jgi:hypothetical protein
MTYTPNFARFWAVWRARKSTGKTYGEIGKDFGYAGAERVRQLTLRCDRQLAFALKQEWDTPCASFVREGTLGVTFTFTLGEEGHTVSLDEDED